MSLPRLADTEGPRCPSLAEEAPSGNQACQQGTALRGILGAWLGVSTPTKCHRPSGSHEISGLGSASPRGPHDCPSAMSLMLPRVSPILTKVLFLHCDHKAEVIATG